jgi:dipeptidyl aminopeptidase/acylaminoacyl peptidase
VTGHDFVSYPRLSPDGYRLAFTTWEHPRMPWDGTELWVADVSAAGLSTPRRVAGGPTESIWQPGFSPEGVLHWVSDASGWWNLYREGAAESLAPMSAEFGRAQWAFGGSTYAFLADGRIACTWQRDGVDHLGVLEGLGLGSHKIGVDHIGVSASQVRLRELATPWRSFGAVVGLGGARLALVAASPVLAPAIATLDVDSGEARVERRAHDVRLAPEDLSEPEPISFASAGGRTAHALYYAPRNARCAGPAEERPPLLVFSHGGPTGATSAALNLAIQFWTSRGIAVVEVNYGGSTGYGRAYRDLLRGAWGVVDVEDCIAAARALAERGAVDAARLAIRGGSAGGYTTLCALAFHDVFAAGASYYGVADAEALARDTHNFESRYLDSLIGPWPEEAERYRARSPLHAADRIRCPLLLLQGLEDAVVPPQQSEVMVEALAKNGVPHAYLPFPGEQHGLRRAENIERAAHAELAFYGRVLGFAPAEALGPLEIRCADALPGR